jgi:predicted component of type VI protein secretion system
VIHQSILSLLNRRGVWMSTVEIFDASPDYPIGDYVIADLKTLKANGLLASRQRRGSSVLEYGLPTWVNAPEPAFSLAYFSHMLNRLIRQVLAAT